MKILPRTNRGYTLVELLIGIGIVAILITFGLNAYAKAQERQNILAAKEKILSVLQDAQKASYVGDKDCSGTLFGIETTFTATSIRTQARCSGGNGTLMTSDLTGITITPIPPTITFRPLDQGVSFSSGTMANIDYQISGSTYRVTIEKPGIIRYAGKI